MKKIFLIPLLTLMCSITAWAEGETYVAKIIYADPDAHGKASLECLDYAALKAGIAGLNYETKAAIPDTVILLQNIDATLGTANEYGFHFESKTNVLLNLNGKGITLRRPVMSDYNDFSMGGPSGHDIDHHSVIYNEGTLHIISEGNAIVQMPIVVDYNNSLGSATIICNSGELTIDGGIFIGPWHPSGTGSTFKMPVIWSKDASSVININGGTFLCDESASDYARGPIFGPISGGGTWNIKGGIFSTSDEVYRVADGYATKTDHKSTKDHWLTPTTGKALPEGYEAIDVPYTNANITGYHDRIVANERNESTKPGYLNPKKVCVVVPTTNRYEVTTNENTTGNADYNFVYVDPGKTLTIKDGHKVTVGDAGVILGGADSKIIIEAGGTLVSGGDIVTSSEENLELTMDAVNDKYAQLMIKPNAIQDKHPDATVILKSKAYKKGGAYTWQRFAVPTYLDGDQSLTRADMLYDNTTYPTALYRWDYESTRENKWTAMDNSTDKFKPFDCYELTTNNTTKGGEYTFKCELVGNGDANLQLDNDRWSYFANSYTAPINIEEMLWELFTNATYKNNIAASVYVHNRADENWDLVSFADVLDEKTLAHNNINPMQAFVLWKIAAIDDYTLHYEDVIYKPAMGIPALHAPARRAQAGMDYQRASIVFSDENGKKDIVKLYEGSDFDNTLNNGFDVAKLMNEGQFSVYAVAEEGEMARLASDNIENATISMQTKGATTFTLSFENVKMEGYGVRDNLTGTTTEIKEGNIYHFTTPANAVVEGRFQVVAMPKITTAVENIENATATKGIYTLTGIYMGEDFNAVPAGIYIVNGKKMVK